MKRLPKGYRWKISQNWDGISFQVIVYDSNETIESHKYKTCWWAGETIAEAKEKAFKELERIRKKEMGE